jgi:hypothetical protein
MSNRDRRKPPSRRRERPAQAGADSTCLLCDARHATYLGIWLPTAAYASFLGSRAIPYTVCGRCAARPGLDERVELTILARHAADQSPPPTEDVDGQALDRISTFGGIMRVEDEDLPIVLPRAEGDDHAEFDRRVCAAGLKAFVRPAWESDRARIRELADHLDEPAMRTHPSHVLIRELSPGVRTRLPVQYFPEGSLN